jgi:hypothetical protein
MVIEAVYYTVSNELSKRFPILKPIVLATSCGVQIQQHGAGLMSVIAYGYHWFICFNDLSL